MAKCHTDYFDALSPLVRFGLVHAGELHRGHRTGLLGDRGNQAAPHLKHFSSVTVMVRSVGMMLVNVKGNRQPRLNFLWSGVQSLRGISRRSGMAVYPLSPASTGPKCQRAFVAHPSYYTNSRYFRRPRGSPLPTLRPIGRRGQSPWRKLSRVGLHPLGGTHGPLRGRRVNGCAAGWPVPDMHPKRVDSHSLEALSDALARSLLSRGIFGVTHASFAPIRTYPTNQGVGREAVPVYDAVKIADQNKWSLPLADG